MIIVNLIITSMFTGPFHIKQSHFPRKNDKNQICFLGFPQTGEQWIV